MATSTETAEVSPRKKREQNKLLTRTRIGDELIQLITEGSEINHDIVAERTGISRRTIYRYFPDRDALLEDVWSRVAELAGKNIALPRRESDLTSSLTDLHTGFDRIAPIVTLVSSTPQGRAMRLASRKKRVSSYTAATANAVKDLPPADRKLATAVIQTLHAISWLEMRDQWNTTGTESARAIQWAIRTLLADLHERGGLPIDQVRPAREAHA